MNGWYWDNGQDSWLFWTRHNLQVWPKCKGELYTPEQGNMWSWIWKSLFPKLQSHFLFEVLCMVSYFCCIISLPGRVVREGGGGSGSKATRQCTSVSITQTLSVICFTKWYLEWAPLNFLFNSVFSKWKQSPVFGAPNTSFAFKISVLTWLLYCRDYITFTVLFVSTWNLWRTALSIIYQYCWKLG
jgi:hypothetical protein